MQKKQLGFIGLGVMGNSMAQNLMKAGYALNIYTRTKSKASQLINLGAIWHSSPQSLAQSSEIVFTMVGYPHDVQEVILGKSLENNASSDNSLGNNSSSNNSLVNNLSATIFSGGLLQNMPKNSIICDMTTSSPQLAEQLALEAEKYGILMVDAPVTGGDIGAKEATLSIFVGTDPNTFTLIKPYLEIMGKTIIHIGTHGLGQRAKLANQIGIAGATFGMAESILYAKTAGIQDLNQWLEAVIEGAAGSHAMKNLGPKVLNHNYEPGFYVEHFLKDLKLCIDECKRMNLNLPLLNLAENTYNTLSTQGYNKKGTQILAKALATMSGKEI